MNCRTFVVHRSSFIIYNRYMAASLPATLSLADVIRACGEEARVERRAESGYCRELFRRALDEHDSEAWAAVDQQYRRLVLRWIYAGNRAELAQDEADDAASDALARFWKSLSAQRNPVAERFAHVGALLGYLQRCAICEMQTRQRQAQRVALLGEKLQAGQLAAPAALSPETLALDALTQRERIADVRAWIREHVDDPAERLLLDLVYRQGLAPAEIAQQHPDMFADVKQVYRIHERLLKRARRALAEQTPPSSTEKPAVRR